MSYVTTCQPTAYQHPFNRVFNAFFENQTLHHSSSANKHTQTKSTERFFTPRIDVLEASDHYKVVVDLPGFSKDQVEIDVLENVLTLKTKQSSQNEEKSSKDELTVLRRERSNGHFERQFKLDDTVNAEQISAKLEQGVLEVTLPKQEEVQPKKQSVTVQ